MTLDRRSFLKLAAVASAGVAGGSALQGTAFASTLGLDPDGVFQYGVASGDPLPGRLIIWTRVTPVPSASPGSGVGDATPVRWVVATDPRLKKAVASGSVNTSAASDHTVKVDVGGLEPATTYWYGFVAKGQISPVGRGRTAPAAGSTPERLRFGLASCSNYAAGFFAPYRFLAARNDLDFILHVGDYIYEYGDGQFGATRPLDPPTEIVELEDYRRRHALYKADSDLRAAHAAHTWITTIDDHEITNDTWRDGAQNHQPATEGSFSERRSVAFQAYLEWMPIRVTPVGAGGVELYRSFRFGTLADLVMLDLRSYRDAPATTAAQLGDPARTLLGARQKQWLQGELATPTQWKLLGNSVQLMTVNYPPTGLLGNLLVGPVERNQDAWDGYPFDQAAVLGQAATSGYDLVALTGDIHTTWAANLRSPSGAAAGVEFVCTSVTSDNVNELLGQAPRNATSQGFEGILKTINAPRIPLVELDSHGVSVVEVTAARVQCDWWYVSDRTDPAASMTPGFSAQSVRGSRTVTPLAPGFAPMPLADDISLHKHADKAAKPQPRSLGLAGRQTGS
ncbi:MAG: alkaline phosphatase D family protein [Mycobacteriales bacterium]|nr:alkaline phosphatase D family protein [Mycobacteriales bacterium]